MMMQDVIVVVILSGCSLIALATLYWGAVKSNKILFYDNNERHTYSLVTAGGDDKDKKQANISILGKGFHINGERIEESSYEKMVVHGNSMRKFKIKNGDIVLVDEQYKKEDLSKDSDSIIVFKVSEEKLGKKIQCKRRIPFIFNRKPKIRRIEYRLRKFIDFVDPRDIQTESDFQKWIKEKHSDLKEKLLIAKYHEEDNKKEYKEGTKSKIDKCIKNNSRLVLSETRKKKEEDKWYQRESVYYSLLPENDIFGKVEYKIPRERVYILNKV